MGIQAELLKLYFSIESGYYSICDSLQKQGIPIYEYFVTPVEKRGYPSFPVAILAIILLGGILAAVFLLPFSASQQIMHVSVRTEAGQPVSGALVELLSGTNQVLVNATTNSTGEVFLYFSSASKVKVSHSQYNDVTIPLRETQTLNITLRLKTNATQAQPSRNQTATPAPQNSGLDDINSFIDEAQFGSVEVHLAEQGSTVPINGVVKAFDFETDNEIKAVASVGGAALFEDLPLNQHVYFASIISGFSSNKTGELVVKRERQSVDITFLRVPTINTTISIISNLTRQPLSGAVVKIFDANNLEIGNGTTNATSNLTFTLTIDKQYYVTAKKSAFLTAFTDLFAPATRVFVPLNPATPEATSTLKVIFTDEYGEPISGIASIYREDGRIIDQKPTPSSNQEFTNLQRNSTIKLTASVGDMHSEQTILLNDSIVQITIQMELRFAKLSLTAIDVLTQQPITEVNAVVQRNGEYFSNCQVPCNLTVKTRGYYSVNFSQGQYFDYLFTFGTSPSIQNTNVFEENSITPVSAIMMPLSAVQDSRVILNGVFDAVTLEKIPTNGTLKQNRAYFSSLSGYFANTQVAHVLFSPAFDSQKPVILNFTPYPNFPTSPNGLEARVSTSTSKKDCGSGLDGQNWKRVLLSIPHDSLNPFSQNYKFYFVAEVPSSSTDFYSAITVAYKSLIKRGEDVIRNPFDQKRGKTPIELSGDNSECDSQMYSASFNTISPNQEKNQLGLMEVSFTQSRTPGQLVTTTNKPESCNVLNLSADSVNQYSTYDCNGFSVDSGFASPLQVKVDILLNNFSKGGIVKLSADPALFSVINASYSVPDRPATMYLSTAPTSSIFEQDVTPILVGLNGYSHIIAEINLSATSRSTIAQTELLVSFVDKLEDGSLSSTSLNKTISVSLNSVREPPSKSLLSGLPCANQSKYEYSYDDKLAASGSRWFGCSEIPLMVDPIFPGDAVPIYIKNSTTGGSASCSVPVLTTGIRQTTPSPTSATNCFELIPDDATSLVAAKEGYKAYLLKFDSTKCGGVTGNEVFVSNASFDISCPSALGDKKTINVTVRKQTDDHWNNLVVSELMWETYAPEVSNPTTKRVYQLDPRLLLVIDNLQLKDQSAKRQISFKIGEQGNQINKLIADQPSPAFAVAQLSNAQPLKIFENDRQLSTNDHWVNPTDFESGYRLGGGYDTDIWLQGDTNGPTKALLEYIQFADRIRNDTAFRRSGGAIYYCQGNEPYSLDSTKCRPTLNDWIETVPSVTTRVESCVVCQPGNNCDSTCNAITGKKPDGSPCFNSCGDARVCESATRCDSATNTKQVQTPGRSTQRWLNTTELVPVKLFSQGDENAPFKYFPENARGFNYTIVAHLSKDLGCTDSISDVQNYNGKCFVKPSSKSIIDRYTPLTDVRALFDLNSGSLKISEAQGGCEYSDVWDRGYYRVTFSYYFNEATQSWKWTYYIDPIQVSSDYIERPDSNKFCNLPSVGGAGQRNTKLCYFTFTTSQPFDPQNSELSPGYCVRSLRDYIPDPKPDSTNRNFVLQADLALVDVNPVFAALPASVIQKVPKNVYLRDLYLSSFGTTKCNYFDNTPPFVNLQEQSFSGNEAPNFDLNVHSFGLSYAGQLDWINNVSGGFPRTINDHNDPACWPRRSDTNYGMWLFDYKGFKNPTDLSSPETKTCFAVCKQGT